MLKLIKRIVRPPLDLTLLSFGLLRYAVFGKNGTRSAVAMIHVFCRTGGRSNEILSRIIGFFRPPLPAESVQGVLGSLSENKLGEILSALDDKGYYVLPAQLPPETIDHLMRYALTQQGLSRRMDAQDPKKWKSELSIFQRESPTSVRFDYRTQDLVCDPVIQKIFCDPTILQVASRYLRTTPILDIVTMWWHTSFSKTPDSEAAQYFHFDMDRLKWLKFFFYLTDVETDNGPHIFVEGSHRPGGNPPELLAHGYSRLSDEQVASHFSPGKIIEFTGKKGTIIIEDTKGLHKGKHVHRGDRLIFQLEYTNSLFGGASAKIPAPAEMTPEMRESLRRTPRIFEMFTANPAP